VEGSDGSGRWARADEEPGARRITEYHSQVWGKRSMGVSKQGLSLDETASRSGADRV
jgi:hypothetical protein